MILFADLHLRPETEDMIFRGVFPGLLEAALVEAKPHLVCLGDFFHVRYQVPVSCLNRVHEWLTDAGSKGVRVDLLPGNHDQIDVVGRHALEVFSEHENVHVWTNPGWSDFGYFVPYRKDATAMTQALVGGLADAGSRPKVAFVHGGLVGAKMNDAVVDQDGISVSALKGWKTLFFGHYHARQKLARGKAIYVGSPYQTRADEAGQAKGYGTWNGQAFAWVDRTWGARFVRLSAAAVSDLGVLADLAQAGDHIRVTATAGADVEELSAELIARGFTDYVVTPERAVETEARIEVEAGAGIDAYARGYVELRAGELDPARLMETFDCLTGRTPCDLSE